MSRHRIHLIAPAGSLATYIQDLGFRHVNELLDLARESIGSDYEVSANATVLSASEEEARGGRTDDVERARDIESALADDNVVALVALRGGAWLTRILPRIDFGVLDRRTRPIIMMGFSELTTLVNIVGAHPNGFGIYELSPAFLTYGIRRSSLRNAEVGANATGSGLDEHNCFAGRLKSETAKFFASVSAMIEGRREIEPVHCTLIRGNLDGDLAATFVGGNLTVLSTLIGSRFADSIDPTNRWIMLEDFNDKPERFDRLLAHLTLAGFWDRCAGVLLGDFHMGERDLHDVIAAMLDFHLPENRNVPVLATRQVGHVWPLTPLPLHRPLRIRLQAGSDWVVNWPADLMRVI